MVWKYVPRPYKKDWKGVERFFDSSKENWE
jgi:hypothetical protein